MESILGESQNTHGALKRVAELESELRAVTSAALADKVVMQEYIASLRREVADAADLRDAQESLAAQIERLVMSLQEESGQIVALVSAVQSSQFWRLKWLLRRMSTRLIRRR